MKQKGQMSQNEYSGKSEKLINLEETAIQTLIDYCSKKEVLTDKDISLIKEFAEYLKIEKGTFLHKSGMIASHTFFIVKGLFRLYKIDENGEEFNLQFSAEEYWINDYESYLSDIPSENYIEALENSEVISFRKDKLKFILENSKTIHSIVDKLIAQNSFRNKERLMQQLKDSPQKRYEYFVKNYSSIYSRLPLYMIASYIGVSRKTLTRIRGGK